MKGEGRLEHYLYVKLPQQMNLMMASAPEIRFGLRYNLIAMRFSGCVC